MSFEGLDNDHGHTTGWADVGSSLQMVVNDICFWDGIEGVVVEEFTQSLQLFDPGVIGEQTVVTDAVEAGGQHVDEKAPDELVGGQGHGFVTITRPGAIVLPLEGDTALITSEQTAVGDRDPMSVARQAYKKY